MKKYGLLAIALLLITIIIALACASGTARNLHPTRHDNRWCILRPSDLNAGKYHSRHAELFGEYVSGYNYYVLKAIDVVQAHVPDGGGYFADIHAEPAESPIGYTLELFGTPHLEPPRKTSYCSGSTYTAFIEALNMILHDGAERISAERLEAMRMQEPDSGRREDGVKFWGHWNADGFGSHFALVQYSGMGMEITPGQARPGDFINISWRNGGGHSVIFLGWTRGKDDKLGLLYWSSQKGTNGCADVHLESVTRIKEVKIVRLVKPGNLFSFNPRTSVDTNVPGDTIFAH